MVLITFFLERKKMKVRTTKIIHVSKEEVNSILTKVVEKKTNKKVSSVVYDEQGIHLTMVEDESDLSLDNLQQ